MRILCSAILAASAAFAQAGNLASPGVGFVFDPSAQAIRRVQGIPGAALVGDTVDLGFPLAAATVAPHQDSALVSDAAGTAHFFRLTGAPQEVGLGSLLPASRMVYSPSGTAAALYTTGRVQVLRGLSEAPAISATVALHGAPKSAPVIAISDDGAYILAAAGGSVELIGVASDARKLMDAPLGALVAFASGGHDAAVVHRGTLTFIQDAAGAGTLRTFSVTEPPSAIAFSPDARTLFMASVRSRSVVSVDVATGNSASIACDCAPTELVSMGGFLRLNELSSDPLWLIDTVTNRGLVFVPARASN
jgi:hypothetical protein